MRQVRRGLFESNSSSTHNLAIRGRRYGDPSDKTAFLLDILELDLDKVKKKYVKLGKLCPDYLEFGWSAPDWERDLPSYKLSYLLTFITQNNENSRNGGISKWTKNGDISGVEAFKKDVERVLKDSGLRVAWPVGPQKDEYYPYGYIDHQSVDWAQDLFCYLFKWASYDYWEDKQKDYDKRLLNFLFHPDVILKIESDG